jgi:hypothetical protein
VVLGAGSDQGVREGLLFVIYELGDEIYDPETSESLGRLEIVKGRVKVTHVQDKISHASTLSRIEKEVIDPMADIRSSILRGMVPHEVKTVIQEELKVDNAVAVQTDLTVRVGDKARSVE